MGKGNLATLRAAAPQLKHLGSFDPDKMNPEEEAFLMRVEGVYINAYGGEFREFFGAVINVYRDAMRKGENPEDALVEWLDNEVHALRIDARLKAHTR